MNATQIRQSIEKAMDNADELTPDEYQRLCEEMRDYFSELAQDARDNIAAIVDDEGA